VAAEAPRPPRRGSKVPPLAPQKSDPPPPIRDREDFADIADVLPPRDDNTPSPLEEDLPDGTLRALSASDLSYDAHVLEDAIGAARPNVAAIGAWRSKARDAQDRAAELTDATKRRDEAKLSLDNLRKERSPPPPPPSPRQA
jgi:hypothetical protein